MATLYQGQSDESHYLLLALGGPTPSWRRLVEVLEASEEHQAANKVRPYMKPPTGKYY